jgi:hypothetical protein
MRFFTLALGIVKAAQGNDAVADQSSIRGKDHIRGARLRFDKPYIGSVRHGSV